MKNATKSSNLLIEILKVTCALVVFAVALPSVAVEKSSLKLTGTLTVIGIAHPSQVYKQVLAIPCEKPSRKNELLVSNCGKPIAFELNEKKTLKAGNYILGFSNTIYPGFVHIDHDENKQIVLEEIRLPRLESNQSLKILRNMNSLMEQRKIYFTIYYMQKHIFRQREYSFGDMYLAGEDGGVSSMKTFNQKSCLSVNRRDLKASDFAEMLCQEYRNASSMMDLADFFLFEEKQNYKSTFQEAFLWSTGDIFSIRYKRLLVSLPIRAEDQDLVVSVFPGSYNIEVSGSDKAVISSSTVAHTGKEFYEPEQLLRKFSKPLLDSNSKSDSFNSEETSDDDGEVASCDQAKRWKTESRSYCTSDTFEGCDRQLAQQCRPQNIIDFRFRTN